MTRWIGRYLMITGIIHALLTLLFFGGELEAIYKAGLWNSVSGQPDRMAAFWFLFSGFLLVGLGVLADYVEKAYGVLPVSLGYSLLLLALLILLVLPVSGGWLLLLPAIAIIYRYAKRFRQNAD